MSSLTDLGRIIVVGHLCLDLTPDFLSGEMPEPGKLVVTGPIKEALGGAVANTGLALHQLGMNVRLRGKIGPDKLGARALDLINEINPQLTGGIIVDPGSATSYSIVQAPKGKDRSFLHFPGANDTFCADDINYEELQDTRIFHFGYPPLMKRMYVDNGWESALMFKRVKARGVTTSLDLVEVNPDSEAGKVNWCAYHEHVLSFVDIFSPSIEEVLAQLFPGLHKDLMAKRLEDQILLDVIDCETLSLVGDRILELGPAIVCLKLGRRGIYLRTTSDIDRLRQMGRGFDHGVAGINLRRWIDRELLGGIYTTDVASTNGAGDAAIAGLLSALVSSESPEMAVHSALATASFRVQHGNINGIPSWQGVRERIIGRHDQAGPSMIGLESVGWTYSDRSRLWHGPNDSTVRW